MRGRIPDYLIEGYEPEHKRLNINTSKASSVLNLDAPKRSFKSDGGRVGQTAFRNRAPQHATVEAEPVPVHIGNHNEQIWVDALGDEEEIDIESLQNINQNHEFYNTLDFENMDEPNLPEEEVYIRQKKPERRPKQKISTEPNTPNLSNVIPGSYVLLINDNIISIGNSEKVIQIAEDLVLNKNIPIDNIVILKRIGLNFGAFFNEK